MTNEMTETPATMPECREAFERYYSNNGKWPQAIERVGDGYKLMQAHSSWAAWQAAWNIRADLAAPSGQGSVEMEIRRIEAYLPHIVQSTPSSAHGIVSVADREIKSSLKNIRALQSPPSSELARMREALVAIDRELDWMIERLDLVPDDVAEARIKVRKALHPSADKGE